MTDQRCPHCGVKLMENSLGDLVCPNCGIVKHHTEENKETPSYLG